jgi:hypothetical protein
MNATFGEGTLSKRRGYGIFPIASAAHCANPITFTQGLIGTLKKKPDSGLNRLLDQ